MLVFSLHIFIALVRLYGDIFNVSVLQKAWLKERGLWGRNLAIHLAGKLRVPYFYLSFPTQQTRMLTGNKLSLYRTCIPKQYTPAAMYMEEYNLKCVSLEWVRDMVKCYVGSYRAVTGMHAN